MSLHADCVFCRIVKGEIPASVVYQNIQVMAFLDINPVSPGHLLLIPKEHYDQIQNVPADVCGQLLSCIPALGQALLDITGASGFNVLINNGREAGQLVPHVHAHLIPRRPMDDLGFRWPAGKYDEGQAQELLTAFHKAISVI